MNDWNTLKSWKFNMELNPKASKKCSYNSTQGEILQAGTKKESDKGRPSISFDDRPVMMYV